MKNAGTYLAKVGVVGSNPIARSNFIPARAGNTKGEAEEIKSALGSSPRGRGTHLYRRTTIAVPRIIPARAGNTRSSGAPSACPPDHPRAGGEHQIKAGSVSLTYGSSPRGRGTHRLRGSDKYGLRIIPARAGNTLARLCGPRSPSDHPRAGGEHAQASTKINPYSGSSPRGRGTRSTKGKAHERPRIIPARG